MNALDGYTGPDIRNPLRAIRAKCLDCSCYNEAEVRTCAKTGCPLYPFRMARNPYRIRVMTEEQKAAATARLHAACKARA